MQTVKLSIVDPESSQDAAIDVFRFTEGDFKDWWGRGILNNTAYVAIAIEIERRENVNDSRSIESISSQKLEVDLDSFCTRWATDDGIKYKQLSRPELLAALAVLHKKGELSVKTRQLSLDFNSVGGEA